MTISAWGVSSCAHSVLLGSFYGPGAPRGGPPRRGPTPRTLSRLILLSIAHDARMRPAGRLDVR